VANKIASSKEHQDALITMVEIQAWNGVSPVQTVLKPCPWAEQGQGSMDTP
jgi:hypothetical protein